MHPAPFFRRSIHALNQINTESPIHETDLSVPCCASRQYRLEHIRASGDHEYLHEWTESPLTMSWCALLTTIQP